MFLSVFNLNEFTPKTATQTRTKLMYHYLRENFQQCWLCLQILFRLSENEYLEETL